ncbi:MAG TPA: Omp28-related outer membrane protein [Taishania sp.]|nr:Omp28-related outer membrane protein [Taishania sp.]
MKNLRKYIGGLVVAVLLFGCDKVDNIYHKSTYSTELNTALYPGDWQDYLGQEWPNFDTITASTQRNVLIDDFTGHNCQYCPTAATVAHGIHNQYPARVFVSSVHSSPTGITGFQAVNAQYPVDFTNAQGLELGQYFGAIPTTGFNGNPSVGCNRIVVQGGTEFFYPAGILANQVNQALNSSLKIALKAHVNYYNDTKGAFVHTEVEILDPALTNLGMNVVIQQDSLIAPQNVNGTYTPDYIHRDIHRGHITNNLWGRTLSDDLKKENGKYYLDYSFVVPDELTLSGSSQFNANNMHLLIYVYDKSTFEIYQVVKQQFN